MENTLTAKQNKSFSLTGTQLKLIALILMFFDHIHYFFGFTGDIPLWFSMLGRLAGQLFLFVTVEGFSHTSNRKKYFCRIWLMGAAMGAANYFIALFLQRGDGFFPINNIMATLTLLMVFWQGIDWLKQRKILPGLAALIVPFLLLVGFSMLPLTIMPYAYFLEQTLIPLPLLTEGGPFYIVYGLILYLLRNKKRGVQVGAWAIAVLGLNLLIGIQFGLPFGMEWITYHYEWMGVFAGIFMLMYNGQRGRNIKNLFYVFYPAHVYGLWALSLVVYSLMK